MIHEPQHVCVVDIDRRALIDDVLPPPPCLSVLPPFCNSHSSPLLLAFVRHTLRRTPSFSKRERLLVAGQVLATGMDPSYMAEGRPAASTKGRGLGPRIWGSRPVLTHQD